MRCFGVEGLVFPRPAFGRIWVLRTLGMEFL